MVKTRLQSGMADLDEIHQALKDIQSLLDEKATKNQIDLLMRTLNDKEERIAKLEKDVEEIKASLEIEHSTNLVLSRTIELLEKKADDNESYLRRQCLRITGIPEEKNENGDKSLAIAKKEIKKLGITMMDCEFDRAHRIGPKQQNKDRPLIVKFTSWRARTLVYKKRKKKDKVRFYLDLTKRRFKLLKDAGELVKDNEEVDFVFADTNNNICIRFVDGAVCVFSSVEELTNILTEP